MNHEQLITIDEIALRLRVGRRTAERRLPRLIANGLQPVQVDKKIRRFRQQSFDALIKESAETGRPLV